MVRDALQQITVWMYKAMGESVYVHGILLIDPTNERLETSSLHLANTLRALELADSHLYELVAANIRLLIISDRLDKTMSPYGGGFIPWRSAAWSSTKELGSWLVWTATYVKFDRGRRTRPSSRTAIKAEAMNMRRRFRERFSALALDEFRSQ